MSATAIIAVMLCVVFDMDGVIWRGYESLPGVSDCIETLRQRDLLTGFLTNNSVRSRQNYIETLSEHNIPARLDEIMTSGEATARHLLFNGHSGKRVFVIGGDGLAETLIKAGFIVDTADEGAPCEFVIVGWDRGITFNKIARAQLEILENNAKFIATNADSMFPAKGRFLPGAGSMVSAIATASGKSPEIIGKPNTISLEYLLDNLGASDFPHSGIWMIGDRLDTDIACGNTYGANTVLVTTGVTTRELADSSSHLLKPDYIIDSLSQLPSLIS